MSCRLCDCCGGGGGIVQFGLFKTSAAFIRAMRETGFAGQFLNFSVVGIDPLFTALGKESAAW